MLSVRAARLAAVVGLGLIPVLAKAQTAPADTPPVSLPPVTVTAGRGSDLEKLDVSTTVMTREQIQAAPETGVDQIINRIPGVWSFTVPTGQLHPTGQPFSIRGFGSSTTINTLVMVDGVPINDPFFRTVDWSRISKGSVERIEVIRGGGATSLWGNMAMGGVVNIVTRQPTRTGVSADVSYGSYNTANAEVGGTVAVNDNLKVGLTYNHAQSSGYNLTPAQYQNANLVPTASKVDNIDFSTYLTPSENLKLFAKAYFHQAYEDGLVFNIAHNQWSSYRMLVGGSYQLDERSSINFNAWAGGGTFGTINASTGSYTLNNISATNQFVSQIETAPNSDQGGSVFYQLDLASIKDIKIGIDARRIVISDYNNLFASATAAPTSFIANGEHRLQGVFGQGTYRFSGIPLDVTIGLRGDFYQALNANVLTVNSGTNLPVANSSASSFDPRIGLQFHMTDDLVLRAAAYRNFSAPGMNQMYRSFASGTSFTAINPNLQPMTNIGEEAGFDFKWREFNLSATVFNNNLDNFIDFVTVCNTNAACAAPFITAAGLSPSFTTVRQYNNVGSATFQGVRGHRRLAAAEGPSPQRGLHRHQGLSHELQLSDTGTDRSPARPGAELDGDRRGRMAAHSGACLHRHPEVVPRLLERHGPHPAERCRDPHRPWRDLFPRQGRGHLRQHPKPYQRQLSGDGLYLDFVRRSDGQHDVHSDTGNALDRHRRTSS